MNVTRNVSLWDEGKQCLVLGIGFSYRDIFFCSDFFNSHFKHTFYVYQEIVAREILMEIKNWIFWKVKNLFVYTGLKEKKV